MEVLLILGGSMNLLEGKKFILIGIVVVLLAAIPLTVFFLQQNQETRSKAQAATTLYFSSPGQTAEATTIQAKAGENVPIDIVMNPGSNQVSFVKLSISYDATKLMASESGGIQPNTATFPSVLEGPTYTDGNISVTLSIGADPTKVVQTASKIATVNFKAKETTGSTPTQVKFLDGQTQVLSIASTDQPSENVLAATKPVNVVIGSTTASTPSATTTPGPTTANVAPSCTSLTMDRTPSGTAPFAVTFTANGRDTDGTISKVTFNFGDGPVQDVSQTGGIGTNTVSVPIAHTYNNPGTFQASAVMTDNQGNISSNTCTQTITVLARPTTAPRTGGTGSGGAGGVGTGGVGGSGSATTQPVVPTTVPTTAAQNIQPQPSIASPGPGDTIVKVGIIGTILSIVGALTFFAL